MTAPRIELRGVSRRFGEVVAVDSVDLAVDEGSHVAILGPSGSGKSTLLRLVTGLDDPDSGEVLLAGVDQRGIPPHRRDIAVVFQHYALYPHLTALRNITTGLRYGLGLPRDEAERRAREVAATVGIEDLLDRKPRAMSGGQRQRVALARALARRSGVVLLDEPLSGLDAQLRMVLRVQISAHLQGATVLHVTHDQADAMTSADLVAVMKDGRIVQIGAPDDVYETPATTFVASFVGVPPMNLFPAGLAAGGVRSVFGFHPGIDRPLVFGVRPSDLRPGTGAWEASAAVQAVEHAGHERIIHVALGGELAAIRTTAGASLPAPGEVLRVVADPGRIHVFDASSGLRLGDAARLGVPAPEPAPAHAAGTSGTATPDRSGISDLAAGRAGLRR